MNINRKQTYCGLAAVALMLAGASLSSAQTADLTINTFDSDPGGNVGHEWGSGTQAFDGGNGNPAGAILVSSHLQQFIRHALHDLFLSQRKSVVCGHRH